MQLQSFSSQWGQAGHAKSPCGERHVWLWPGGGLRLKLHNCVTDVGDCDGVSKGFDAMAIALSSATHTNFIVTPGRAIFHHDLVAGNPADNIRTC